MFSPKPTPASSTMLPPTQTSRSINHIIDILGAGHFDTLTEYEKSSLGLFSHNYFNSLPIETVQHIASFVEYDRDLCSFRGVSQGTKDAVDADGCSFWRRRFLDFFEGSEGCRRLGNEAFKNAYQKRRGFLKNGAQFRTGESRRERECLEVLRDLIIESFSDKKPNNPDLAYTSTNLEQINRFLLANNLLQVIFEPSKAKPLRPGFRRPTTATTPQQKPTQLLLTIQVLCTPLLLSFEPRLIETLGFPDCQIAVYSTTETKPLFTGCYGLDVNMEFVLQNVNFWKYHMVRSAENTLFQSFSELDECDRPRWWSEQLTQGGGRKMGKHWKGSYAYLEREELAALRSGEVDSEMIQDYFAGEDGGHEFQDMTLEIMPEGSPVTWPRAFEEILHSLTPPAVSAKTRAQKRSASPDAIAKFRPLSFQFEGEGQDVMEQFLAAGWLNPLPEQEGIPGWQRMTMMKYFESDTGEIDVDALWAYEGVVLPGGQIILGRWWSPSRQMDEEMYSGPFILWCVDGAKYEEVDGEGREEV